MAAHAYWRINVTANNSDSYTCFTEVQMRASIGGADQCSGGTATSSSNFPGETPDRAFDDTTTTYTQSNGVAAMWLEYAFASPVSVAEVYIMSLPSSGIPATRAPKDFTIEYSDNNSLWITVKTVTGEVSWGNAEARTFLAYEGTLTGNITESLDITDWRITVLKCSNGDFAGSEISTGSTYAVNTNTMEPCNIIIAPKVDYAWSAAKVVVSGEFVVAVDPDTTPHIWTCTTGGTTGGTEPTWNLSGTTNDNTAVWTYVAPLVDPVTLGPKIPS